MLSQPISSSSICSTSSCRSFCTSTVTHNHHTSTICFTSRCRSLATSTVTRNNHTSTICFTFSCRSFCTSTVTYNNQLYSSPNPHAYKCAHACTHTTATTTKKQDRILADNEKKFIKTHLIDFPAVDISGQSTVNTDQVIWRRNK